MSQELATGRARANDAVATLLRYVAETFQLFELTTAGAASLASIGRQLSELETVVPDDDDRRSDRIQRTGEVARAELERDFPLRNSHSVMGLWGALEAAVDDISVGWLEHDEGVRARDRIERLRGRAGAALYLRPEERWTWALEQLKQDQDATLRSGISQFESVLSAIGLGGTAPEPVRRVIIFAKAARNCIAHRGGRIDDRLRADCPEFDWGDTTVLNISSRQTRAIAWAMLEYVQDVRQRFADAIGEGAGGPLVPDFIPPAEDRLATFLQDWPRPTGNATSRDDLS